MPVFSDNFEDPTPLPDPEHSKVPTSERPDDQSDQSADDKADAQSDKSAKTAPAAKK